jgi:hypothetical protein
MASTLIETEASQEMSVFNTSLDVANGISHHSALVGTLPAGGVVFFESTELMLYMLSFLDSKDIVRCMGVCREWKFLCDDHSLWRMLIKR